jgi:hypothetical protein
MNDRSTYQERLALVAGDRAGSLDPDVAAEVALLADLLADPSTWAEPSAALEDAVVQAVSSAAPAGETSASPSAGRARRGATTHRRRVLVSALSAAAAIAIGAGAVVMTGPGTSTDLSAQLRATAAAPGARASAHITRTNAGFRVVLDAKGLPVLPNGEYYQAWLKSSAGTLVPIGTFSSSDGRITLWSGVSPRKFGTISVTIERADNIQTTSGRRVLVGEVHPR